MAPSNVSLHLYKNIIVVIAHVQKYIRESKLYFFVPQIKSCRYVHSCTLSLDHYKSVERLVASLIGSRLHATQKRYIDRLTAYWRLLSRVHNESIKYVFPFALCVHAEKSERDSRVYPFWTRDIRFSWQLQVQLNFRSSHRARYLGPQVSWFVSQFGTISAGILREPGKVFRGDSILCSFCRFLCFFRFGIVQDFIVRWRVYVS